MLKVYDEIFRNIINNKRLSNSYIFYGDECKSFEYAKKFSQMINNTGQHTYIIEKDKILIEDIKEIVDSSKSSPFGYYKIFIIRNFDKIHQNSDEIILKTLEDCSRNIVFILTVKNLSTIKDTIKSRCQKYYFKDENKELSKYLNSYFSQDFFSGFFNIKKILDENNIDELLNDFILNLYLDKCDNYRIYKLVKLAIKDIKFGIDKQLVIENLIIQLKKLN